MRFAVPEEGQALVSEARALLDGPVKQEISAYRRDHASEPGLDADGRLAADVRHFKRAMHRLGVDAGLYAVHLSERLGGRGLSLRASMYLQEEIFLRGFGGQQWVLGGTDGPSSMVEVATERAVEEFVRPLAQAEITTAFALTEPEASSDATGIETTARRSDGDWALRGHKHPITNAPFAEVVQVFARTEDGGFGVFLVPVDTQGVSRGPVQQTILDDGQTGSLTFEDCRIPADMMLGKPQKGFGVPMHWINWTRGRRAGMCSGLARHCLELALEHDREREAFGKPIGSFEQVALQVSEAHRKVWAARTACDRLLAELDAADLWEHPEAEDRANFSAIKLISEESLVEASDVAIQVLGGLGLLRSTGLEHIFRVARNLRIPGGTTETQRREISRSPGLLGS